MTPETEARVLELLESIDARLSSIAEDANYFRRLNESARNAQASLARMHDPYR